MRVCMYVSPVVLTKDADKRAALPMRDNLKLLKHVMFADLDTQHMTHWQPRSW